MAHYLRANFDEFKDATISDSIVEGFKLSRAAQAAATGNSKNSEVIVNPTGFSVKCYEEIECRINGINFALNTPDGCAMHIADWRSFMIPSDVVVVGMENSESFHHLKGQQWLFKEHFNDTRLLFVNLYPNRENIRLWLQNISNHYVHFGDFDPAGIDIYISNYYNYLPSRSRFLVPKDIETRIANGCGYRFDSQLKQFNRLDRIPLPEECERVKNLIKMYHKGYDQEGYIQ